MLVVNVVYFNYYLGEYDYVYKYMETVHIIVEINFENYFFTY